ncbi:site-2 protease family protein [Priestia megaterium]|uniref:site-2 protease family protein n=1 Tax=Priestia megaterium TaxID=1404 RepID=UPI0035DCAAB8
MVILHILIAIFAFGFLIFFHELFHYLAARAVGVKPKEFAIGFGRSLIAYQKKKFFFLSKKGKEQYNLDEISYHIKILPLGGYVLFERPVENEKGELEVKGDYLKIHPLKRIFIAVAGPIGNLLLAFALMFTLFSPYISLNPAGKVIYVKEHSIADKAGIEVKNRITSFNDKPVKSISNISKYVTSQDKLCIQWKNQDGSQKKCVENNGKKIGVTFSMSLWQGIVFTADGFGNLIKQYTTAFFKVFLHLDIMNFNGPIGTVDAIQQSVPVWENFLGILVLINIALGAANLLLPLSVTDGGKIIIDIICLLRRKRSINTTYLDIVSFGLMACLFILTFFLDMHRIIERFL